jgi:hypothetical protein
MNGPFSTIGAALDRGLEWLFGEFSSSVRGTLHNDEWRKIVGVGLASALSGATPHLARAAAARSKTELGAALFSGFLTGVAGGTVSLLHRVCDGPSDALAPSNPLPLPLPAGAPAAQASDGEPHSCTSASTTSATPSAGSSSVPGP